MSCNDVLDWVGGQVLNEHKNLHHKRGLQGGESSVHYVGEGSDGAAVMDSAGVEVGEGLNGDDEEDDPANTAVSVFLPKALHKGGNQGSWKLLEDGKKRE